MNIVLASASPRRRELLGQIGLAFEAVTSDADERADTDDPAKLVAVLAERKALSVLQKRPDALVIGSDTVVCAPGGEIFGKPRDKDDAARMLTALSGKTHTVYTGVSVVGQGKTDTRVCATRVTFRALSKDDIDGYIATGEPSDKAGAYGIQGRGAVLVESIEGDYFCVMGLPLCTLSQMLAERGVALWN